MIAYELRKIIRGYFPNFKQCCVAWQIIANEKITDPVMSICEHKGWKYIITLSDGSPPCLQYQLKDDPATHHNSFVHQLPGTTKNNSNYPTILLGGRLAAQETYLALRAMQRNSQ